MHFACTVRYVSVYKGSAPPAIQNLVVTAYTRHSAQCAKKNDQYWKRCNCPKWLYINNNGKRSQRSAKTRAWDRAEETRRAVEQDFEDAEQRKRPGAEPEKKRWPRRWRMRSQGF
jgi:hypothetical protein